MRSLYCCAISAADGPVPVLGVLATAGAACGAMKLVDDEAVLARQACPVLAPNNDLGSEAGAVALR